MPHLLINICPPGILKEGLHLRSWNSKCACWARAIEEIYVVFIPHHRPSPMIPRSVKQRTSKAWKSRYFLKIFHPNQALNQTQTWAWRRQPTSSTCCTRTIPWTLSNQIGGREPEVLITHCLPQKGTCFNWALGTQVGNLTDNTWHSSIQMTGRRPGEERRQSSKRFLVWAN